MNSTKINKLACKHAKEYVESLDRISYFGEVGNVFKNPDQAMQYRQAAWDYVDWMPRTKFQPKSFPTQKVAILASAAAVVIYVNGWEKPIVEKIKQQFRRIQLNRNAPKDPWAEPTDPNPEAANQ
jgi:hypothetical protein